MVKMFLNNFNQEPENSFLWTSIPEENAFQKVSNNYFLCSIPLINNILVMVLLNPYPWNCWRETQPGCL